MATSGQLTDEWVEIAGRCAGRQLVVALSGGADSAALAWLASHAASSVRGIHVHHGQPHSDRMKSAAEAVASAVGIRCETKMVQVPEGASFENQARRVRYEALLGALDPGEILVTGHTSDDVAETFLMNASRGAGLTGQAAIPERRGDIWRPLLEVSRKAVRSLAEHAHLPFVDDPSNQDRAIERNRIRHEVVPALGGSAGLARSARLSGQADHFLQRVVDDVPIDGGPGLVRIPRGILLSLPTELSARVIRQAIRRVNPPYPGSTRSLSDVMAVADGSVAQVQIEGAIDVYASQGSVMLDGDVSEPGLVPVAVGLLAFGGWELAIEERAVMPATLPLGTWSAIMADPPDLVVRPMDAGDRVTLTTGGHKDLADVFAEAGIYARQRRRWPVVAAGSDVWWVPGVRRGAVGWGKATSDRYLVMNISQEGA